MLDHPIVKKILNQTNRIQTVQKSDLTTDAYTKSMQIAALSEALANAYMYMGQDSIEAVNEVHAIMVKAVENGEKMGYGA